MYVLNTPEHKCFILLYNFSFILQWGWGSGVRCFMKKITSLVVPWFVWIHLHTLWVKSHPYSYSWADNLVHGKNIMYSWNWMCLSQKHSSQTSHTSNLFYFPTKAVLCMTNFTINKSKMVKSSFNQVKHIFPHFSACQNQTFQVYFSVKCS